MALSLVSVNAKIRRAEDHLQSINRMVEGWYKLRPYRLTKQTNPEYTHHIAVVRLTKPLPSEQLALLAGDCVHALRSALDHLVYSIAVHQTGSNPPPHERALQFPIADNNDLFIKAAGRYLKPLKPETVSRIETLQPYHRLHPQVPPLLAILRDFDDADKHRLLNIIVTTQTEVNLLSAIKVPPQETVRIHVNQGALHDGAEAFAVVTESPQPDLKLNLAVKLAVAVQHASGPTGAEFSGVWPLLSHIRDEVTFVVKSVVA